MKKEYGFNKIGKPDYWPEISAANTPPDDCPTCHGSKTAWNEQYTEYLACPDCVGLCPVCLNQGFVTPAVPYTDPAFGKAVPCPANCKTVQQLAEARRAGIMRYSGLPDGYKDFTFETFLALPPESYKGKLAAYYATWMFAHNEGCFVDRADIARAMNIKDETSNTRNWLVLWGEVGTGKTGLAAAAMNALMAQGRKVRYISFPNLVAARQRRYNQDKRNRDFDDDFGESSADDVLNEILNSPILILDEFAPRSGTHKVEKATEDKLAIADQLVRYRYGKGAAMPTLITSNFKPDDLSAFWGDGIYDVVKHRAHFVPVRGVNLRDESDMSEW